MHEYRYSVISFEVGTNFSLLVADPACKPILVEHQAVFKLSISDFYQCGVTRVVNQATVSFKIYYNIMRPVHCIDIMMIMIIIL